MKSVEISIHAPRTGSDGSRGTQRPRVPISIHAPRTGSDAGIAQNGGIPVISIHAPRTGSDLTPRNWNAHQKNFNPRSPHGERRCWKGTPENRNYFNPRSPHGERLSPRTLKDSPTLFQSTLPARGATRRAGLQPHRVRISIHAPRTGSDRLSSATRSIWANFNPRSPHGERRLKAGRQREMNTFQPTLPARGATAISAACRISFHQKRWRSWNRTASEFTKQSRILTNTLSASIVKSATESIKWRAFSRNG